MSVHLSPVLNEKRNIMEKVTKTIQMLCFIFAVASMSYAHDVVRIGDEKKEGIPIELIEKSGNVGSDKSNFISPTIDGHLFSVFFNANLGQVTVDITMDTGANVEYLSVLTPIGVQINIPIMGDYTVTITLSNGEVYCGEFRITN